MKKLAKGFAIILAAMMLVGLLPTVAFAEAPTRKTHSSWEGSISPEGEDGAGSIMQPAGTYPPWDDNVTPEEAVDIDTDVQVNAGAFNSYSYTRWWKFTLDKPGSVSIRFSSETTTFNGSYQQYAVALYKSPVVEGSYLQQTLFSSSGSVQNSGKYSLPKGTYYVAIRPWSTTLNVKVYQFTVEFTPQPDPVKVTGITLNTASKTVNVGASYTIAATVAPSNAANKKVTWTSSNTAVATVNSTGVVKGIAPGSATITATSADNRSIKTSCKVTVLPKKPTSVKAASSAYDKIKISWGKVAGASGYEVYRATSKAGSYSKVKTVTSGSTVSYTNGSLTAGKTYYYKVRAYKTIGTSKVYSSYSSIVSGKPVPAKPGSVKTTNAGSKKIQVTWGKVTGANGYEVYRSTSKAGSYQKVKTTTKNAAVSFTNTKLTIGKTYYYKVRAYRMVNGKKVYGSFSTIVGRTAK